MSKNRPVESNLIIIGLVVGMIGGLVGGPLGGGATTAGRLVFLLSSVGLVAGALVAALRAATRGETFLAAGLIGYALAEGLVGAAPDEAGFALGAAFYVPAFVLLGFAASLPIWSRLAGLVSGVIWAVYVVLSQTGQSVTSGGGLATAGYIFTVIAVLGWIWIHVRADASATDMGK